MKYPFLLPVTVLDMKEHPINLNVNFGGNSFWFDFAQIAYEVNPNR